MDDIFEDEFDLDDEIYEECDLMIKDLGEALEDESSTTVLNLEKLKQMEFVFAAMKRVLDNKLVKVSYMMNKPYKTMGSISAEGKLIEFDDPMWFIRMAELASNVEVYPLASDKVRITFTFHGLTKPIDD